MFGVLKRIASLEKRVAELEKASTRKGEEDAQAEKLFQDGLSSILNYGGKAAERE